MQIASEDNCVDFFQCYADRAFLSSCPEGTWFNEDLQVRRDNKLLGIFY